ncbi:L-cystine transporter [Cetobacterium sp. 2A]|uniref:L-cystine transporter n=1 Tax=unclassified Cetobacterium TaxID=2630983 RepID=UPI00163CFB50|nr:L-cystine transporter [Cetobacterium sp. 2A]MBC2855504.1 L-cystine transporter [Cetobacterium sp. 2A]
MLFELLNVLVFLVLIGILYVMQKKYVAFSKRVFLALGMGIVLGAIFQFIYGPSNTITIRTIEWINIVGEGYVRLLKMIVMPLIAISILSAIINLKDGGKSLGKIGGLVILVLVGTAAIAAVVGALVANGFGLTADGIEMGAKEAARAGYLQGKLGDVQNISFTKKIIEFIPVNPFQDLTGARDMSTIATVFFSGFLGISALGMAKKKPKSFEVFKDMTNSFHDAIMRMVTLVLRLTPFGVLALITKVVAGSNIGDILNLGKFVVASYVALIAMFIVHLIIIAMIGLNPIIYVKKSLPVLTFAFTSRTSAGAIPMNIETQTEKLGVQEGVANLAASFGSSIGQNGCAAIYPAMLAVMIAPVVGINPMSFEFLVKLVAIIAVSSFGVAGVGGGATFAALIVLSSLNFPVALVGLLISIEPLIDMGRTALNVSGSMVSGLVTAKVVGDLDSSIYNSSEDNDVEDKE